MAMYSLPLFPLNVVVCPGGLLPLRIFEARYIDMVKNCMRNSSNFGLVALLPEGETDAEGNLSYAAVGTSFRIVEADVTTVGLMMIGCEGQNRFRVESVTQQKDGLIIGQVEDIPNDTSMQIPADLAPVRAAFEKLIATFPAEGILEDQIPIKKPYQFEDCGWVANRWLELLNMPIMQKQRLLEEPSPLLRLELIQDLLNLQD